MPIKQSNTPADVLSTYKMCVIPVRVTLALNTGKRRRQLPW